jgi:LAO/AO transport system kinase
MPEPLTQLVRQATSDDRSGLATRAAGRLMTLLENDPARLPELFRAVAAQRGGADNIPQPRLLLGVTGAPGSGKSTLTDALVGEYRLRYPDRKVGVIAVDPSSPFTGGAVLGDRVRMMRHATDPMVYVRSLASRGHLGGLSLGVKGVVRVMGLIGCDSVFIETVGVGQSEVEVARVADLIAIVLAPGQGDSIQLLKAGLMEIGDLFIVNKADREGASQLHAQLLAALQMHLLDRAGGRLLPMPGCHSDAIESADHADVADLSMQARQGAKVFLVSATEKEGVAALVDQLEQHTSANQPQWIARRATALQDDVREAVLEEARDRVADALSTNGSIASHVQRVLAGEITIPQLAQQILDRASGKAQA